MLMPPTRSYLTAHTSEGARAYIAVDSIEAITERGLGSTIRTNGRDYTSGEKPAVLLELVNANLLTTPEYDAQAAA